ncbi:MAG: DUF6036 family nucleotidyltransferase [Clostridiales bacterium]|nr:DUF6036 family nucleotidyltransferase [Clostridiales bacterium]
MSAKTFFEKNTLDDFFRALGKEYRRLTGKKTPAEIILIGGASVLINYGFRDTTYDVDALIQAASSMKEAIYTVSDRFGLPEEWLNSDFKKTKSYSPKLVQYSTFYRMFSNVLTVRTIRGEYLIAMKLMSGRKYKNDISDIIGVLWEHYNTGVPLTFSDIDTAVQNLYGGWDDMPEDSLPLIKEFLNSDDFSELYKKYRSDEISTKEALVTFDQEYPGALKGSNLNDIISTLKKKKALLENT